MNTVPLGGLSCVEVLGHLSEFLDGTLAAPLVLRVREHVAGCRECERFGGAVAAVLAGLRSQWQAEAAGAGAGGGDIDPAVAARLDAAWRRG